jgi:SAP domain.
MKEDELLKKLKVPQLKAELVRRNLDAKGIKKDLILRMERVLAAERAEDAVEMGIIAHLEDVNSNDENEDEDDKDGEDNEDAYNKDDKKKDDKKKDDKKEDDKKTKDARKKDDTEKPSRKR